MPEEKKSNYRLEYSATQDAFHMTDRRRTDGRSQPNTFTYRTLDDGDASEEVQTAFPVYVRKILQPDRLSWNEAVEAWENFRVNYRQLYPEWIY